MSNEKQNPCEAAWDELVNRGRDRKIEPGLVPMGCQEMFAAGFRAGEAGKKELLEACKEVLRIMKDGGMASWEGRAGQMVRAAIAKAKGEL